MKNLLPLAPLLALLTACTGKPTESAPASVAAPSGALAAVLAAAPVGEAKAIHQARATAKPGDTITLSGQVMGAEEPFVQGRAAFVLGDPTVLTPCNTKPGDGCKTPWDVCCDTAEDKKRGTATIQIVDASGAILKESLEGKGGLEKLAFLTVQGQVAAASTPDLLIVNATALKVGK